MSVMRILRPDDFDDRRPSRTTQAHPTDQPRRSTGVDHTVDNPVDGSAAQRTVPSDTEATVRTDHGAIPASDRTTSDHADSDRTQGWTGNVTHPAPILRPTDRPTEPRPSVPPVPQDSPYYPAEYPDYPAQTVNPQFNPYAAPGAPVMPTQGKTQRKKQTKTLTLGRRLTNIGLGLVSGATVTLVGASLFTGVPPMDYVNSFTGNTSGLPDDYITPRPADGAGNSASRGIPHGAIQAGSAIIFADLNNPDNHANQLVTSDCSVTAVLDPSTMISAGHCLDSVHGTDGDPNVNGADWRVFLADTGQPIGRVVRSQFSATDAYDADASLIALDDTVDPNAVTVSTISTDIPQIGDILFKNGATTGITNGKVIGPVSTSETRSLNRGDGTGDSQADPTVEAFPVAMCALPGDSGAGVTIRGSDATDTVIGTVVAYTDPKDPRFAIDTPTVPAQSGPNGGAAPTTPHCTDSTISMVTPISTTLHALGLD